MNENSETSMEGAQPTAPSSTSSEAASVVSTTASTIPKSEAVRPTTFAKPSGLKPPTKIGRLCSNTAPKPALPISPRADGSSSDTLRKLSDDSSRKHLSDLIEADEDEVSSSLPERPRSRRKASTSSRSSITSMDTLWEKYPRRLSEAGLRRSSDHSVVLTEDTDSFIIGERVWVGGTKPGQIAYIGETQFAPGEWAGIVLDDPIGKNDGSVAGFRYFQCPEKRGVFSRLTRLTREPLISHAPHDASPISDAGSVFERPPSGSARPRRTLSPNGSVRSIVSSKMNASISTTTNGDFRLGDRVIVSSSRGSKAGTLRYVGVTEFASGVWAGVELDDPLGKNDGSVDGKRYFNCAPRFGLFAPISKVSRSPSNRKPGTCAIHSNGRATPMRRSNSRESLTSLGTSIASSRAGVRLGVTSLGAQRAGPRASSTPVSAKNALQEVLREKQQHLERLLQERELERAEVVKVTMQFERTESALAQIRKEATQANNENAKLKVELDKLNKMLEDEKQKVEDLMFRNEEENINKEDYNKYKEAMEKEKETREKQIRDLEAEVALQVARAETTSAALRALEDQRSAEMNALADQHKEELVAAQTLSSELQKLLDEAYALIKEKESEKDSLTKSLNEELYKVKTDSEKALNEAKSKIAISQSEFETQLSVLTAKLQLAESKLDAEKQNVERLNKENGQTIIDLNSKLTSLQAAVDDKTLELNKVMGVSKEHEVNLNKEMTKLKMELSAKVLDIEQLEDLNKKQESSCKLLQEEVSRVKEELTQKINEYESFLNEASQQDEKNKTEILNLRQELNTKTKEYEKLVNESSKSTNSNDKLINEYKQTIHERDKEIIKLKDEFEETTANFNIKHSKIAEEHKKEIEDRNTKIEQLIKEIETHKQALDKSKVELDTLNTQFTINVDELNALKEENKKLKESLNEITQVNAELKAKIAAMELEIGEYKRQLSSAIEKCDEIQKSKEKVEGEYLNLTGQTTDSYEQFNKLSQHLKDTEKELQEIKDKYREATNNCGRIEQEYKQKIFKVQEDYSLERGQLVRSVDENVEKLQLAENKIKEFEALNFEINNRLREAESQSDKLLDENSILKTEIESLKLKEQDISNEHDTIRKKLEIDIERYKEEILLLKADGATSEVKLMEKVDQLTEAQNDLNNKLEEARKHEDSLQKILDDMTSQLNAQKVQFEKEINQLQERLVAANNETKAHKDEETRLTELLQEKQNSIKDLTLKLEMLEVDIKSNGELVTEKDRQLTQVTEELNKVNEIKNKIEDQLNKTVMETTTIKQQYETLLNNSSVEESLINEQLKQLEKVKSEMAILVNDKKLLEDKYNESSSEISNLKSQLKETTNKLNETVENLTEVNKIMKEKDNFIKAQNEKVDTDLNKSKQLEENITKLQQEVNQNNTTLEQKQVEISNLNEIILQTSKIQETVKQLESENADLKAKHVVEIESLNNTIKTLTNNLSEQGKQLEDLVSTKEKVKDLQQLLAKSDEDIKKLTNINEAQKLNYEDLTRQLQQQFDEYKRESKNMKHELKNRINDYEKQLQDSKEKIALELDNQNKLQNKLNEGDSKILELSQKLELLAIQENNSSKDEKLEKLTLELQATRQSGAESLVNSEKIINKLKAEIETNIKDIKVKDDLIVKLQEDLKSQKAKVEITEREKNILQKEVAKNGKEIRDNNDNNSMGLLGQGDNASQKLTEEKEMIDGQVSFLNSVIVDMQRKNEQLMARVQALEGATVPTEPPLFNGRKVRAVAPRLFCDICDVFDAHDTEDCPRQSVEPEKPPSNKKPLTPRPYCDICEVFGHATENCDEEETF
ncbi:CAP-Gly domain-containing linker protein 1 isoform X1 [Vanessa atalanta]|uniref:CAP-Gly domain-containing linker protein 1 isoform X1 n=3 Tax=Vanessa atalanta TaxID=42275 RepID=UPI001FCE2680|nr:CAP-Gly domain-containing linker protein 1 isoform X1 [Vanessa atalanta]XP_047527805.1 CAP-Gly domain-containing linker protein 1 isoform X1 [Vanessa atalanta]XP_047527806.1 CAP-Gly domain-containing linker protein 1 isoform X1 [Vanessa atalanta]